MLQIQTDNQRNKAKVLAFWDALDKVGSGAIQRVCADHLDPGFVWNGPAPLGRCERLEILAESFWAPLKKAIPDLRRETHLFFGGASSGRADGSQDGRMWVCGTGYLSGLPLESFLGIPAVGRPVRIRWGEFLRFDGERIVEAQTIIDFIDWFEQIGLPVLPPPRGAAHVFPAPTGYDGVLEAPQDDAETRETLKFGRDFIYGGLNSFDQQNLAKMGMARFFHPNLKWYGPGGIGACLSFSEFETLHQRPWLVAFPDRKVQDLESLFAEGHLLGASGVVAVRATHTGPYLDQPATQKKIEFSGLDFWLRSGDKLTENWVFVDMVHLFAQFGVDLFARMHAQARTRGITN
jgi:predicted ester cyclase